MSSRLFLYFVLAFTLFGCSESPEVLDYTDSVSQEDSTYVYSLIDSANKYRINGSLLEAKGLVLKAKEFSENLNWGRGLSESYTNLGYINLYESDFEAAMQNSVEGLRIAEKCHDIANQGFANMLIGFIYFNLGDTSQVLPYYKRSLNLRLENGDDYSTGFSYSYLGNFYLSTNRYDSALYYHQQALEYRLKTSDTRSIADSYLLIGSTYLKQKKFDSALDYFQQALLKYAELKDKKRLAETYRNFAEVYLVQKNLKDAENFLLQANQLAEETGSLDNIVLITDQLSGINYLEGNYELAYEYLREHVDLAKKASGESKYRDIVKNILEYKNEKEKKIKELEFEKEKEQQKMIVWSVSGLLLLVIGFLIFVFNRLKIARKQREIIAFRKHQIDKAYSELGVKNKEILDSINYAKRIQSAILPSDELIQSSFRDVFVLYLPKDIVAGDFYWLEHKEDMVYFAVADCTGHGVPGAMVSVVCNNSLNRSVHEYGLTKPCEILGKTRELVVNEFSKSRERAMMDGMDIALCSLQDLKNGSWKLTFAGANNPLWVIRKDADSVEEYKGNKQPIGKMERSTPFSEQTLILSEGDTIYLFSDGFADQFGGENGKKLKSSMFKRLLLSIQGKGMIGQQKAIEDYLRNWQGDLEQVDDVCVLGVKF
ncbi:MAG: tetratricopeptide repeat protein [Flavobacteriales bacterium]|nr:tetratricopeptide repeat protein [Flavobacteriales bacterium]